MSPYGDCEAKNNIEVVSTAVLIGLSIVMKLEELKKEDLILMLKSLYNRYRLMSIDLSTLDQRDDEEDKDNLMRDYISEILTDGIDEIILRNVGNDFE